MFHKPSKKLLVNFSKLSAHCYPAKEAFSVASWLNVKLSNLTLWDIEFRINKHIYLLLFIALGTV